MVSSLAQLVKFLQEGGGSGSAYQKARRFVVGTEAPALEPSRPRSQTAPPASPRAGHRASADAKATSSVDSDLFTISTVVPTLHTAGWGRGEVWSASGELATVNDQVVTPMVISTEPLIDLRKPTLASTTSMANEVTEGQRNPYAARRAEVQRQAMARQALSGVAPAAVIYTRQLSQDKGILPRYKGKGKSPRSTPRVVVPLATTDAQLRSGLRDAFNRDKTESKEMRRPHLPKPKPKLESPLSPHNPKELSLDGSPSRGRCCHSDALFLYFVWTITNETE
jgi:hypothetical protein